VCQCGVDLKESLMKNGPKTELEQAVSNAAQAWLQIGGPGDPNTIDLYWQAQRVQEWLELQLPQTLPPKKNGVALVELVETHFVCSSLSVLVRDLLPDAVAERARKLVDTIYGVDLQSGGAQKTYVTALYTWHGCINMAKLLRPSHNTPDGQAAYSGQQRVQGCAWLREYWTQETAKGNPWVRYGVSLARPLEMNSKKDEFAQMIIEDWVPLDSLYWDW
jgi:hypothetical protein